MHLNKTYNFSNEPTGVHQLILENIKSGRVLDIGCAGGYLGEQLIKKNCEVWGIEPSLDYIEAREKGYSKLLNLSVEAALESDDLKNQTFDYIIAADVFEHLTDPKLVLSRLKNFSRDGGKILISLPNVAHYSIRFHLLSGNWDMRDSGILDRTHLHFYTLKTAKKLIEESGWKIEEIRPRGDLERWFRKIGLEKMGKRLLFAWPQVFSIQFVIVAKV